MDQYKKNSSEQLSKFKPEQYLKNFEVFSSDLKWCPKGNQAEKFDKNPIKTVIPNILIAKLREN